MSVGKDNACAQSFAARVAADTIGLQTIECNAALYGVIVTYIGLVTMLYANLSKVSESFREPLARPSL
ncbi:hypothetical protein ROZALSC1DRAFT_31175 [Rozella allomycis CSF55]|uniref:Uncharacterized protein n=1 Tax=Rozella allomycis (strain CSF55) TaxID=988480 RepID=A0A075ANM2_ROZAC|nr:hypothetical protein O9G_005952 [Rozella allomycis CSF55]RKP16982.1 hypothetical protein ROZALSC1DRAFT_31175 [Rozella allomycis CSF55]|eukprot:EPZ31454.1 hypothetical protein O9G_005952 [Rozella allomycis CSF55]